jgi:HEAT repeat protein/energy-coupling factor transporter ATP-binding protein EcfA2
MVELARPYNTIQDTDYVFISYSSLDRAFVDRLRESLRRSQIAYWVDKEGIPPGASRWETAIREAIRGARYVIYVVTPNSFESNVVQGEVALADMQRLLIFPVWASGEVFIDCVPLKMAHAQYIDLRGDRYETGFEQMIVALRGANKELAFKPPTLAPLPSGIDPRNPYKGLHPFQEKDAGDFFGRERLTSTLVSMIRQRLESQKNRLVAVIGPSGSGKSSVVMAGVLPTLRSGRMIPGSEGWVYLPPFTPGGDPLENLAFALKSCAPPGYAFGIRKLLEGISGGGLLKLAQDFVRAASNGAASAPQMVIYIDQFEELFTLVEDEADRELFINNLVVAATDPDSPVLIVLTLRADFYDRPMNYHALGQLIGENNRSVLPLTLGELNDAISLPAQRPDVQLEFEGDLVAEIVFDLLEFRDPADKTTSLAGALPLLQFALAKLYEQREGKLLTLAAYRAMGGVSGAIGSHAEDEFRKIDGVDERTLHQVFYRLIIVDDSGTATRRRAARSEVTRGDLAAEQLVDSLIANRLLVAGNDQVLEVAHEALLRSWQRLGEWISANAHHILWLQQVETAAHDWAEQGKPDRLLWDYEELQPVYDANEHLRMDLDPVVLEFIRPQIDRLLEDFITSPEYRQLNILDRWREIGPDAAPALARALVYAKGDAVLDAIDTGLWELEDPKAAETALIACLSDGEPAIRAAAAQAIGRLGMVGAADALIANLRLPGRQSTLAEIEALNELADMLPPNAELIPALISTLHDQIHRHMDERCAAAHLLGRLGSRNRGVGQALIQALTDRQWEVRRDVVLALGQARVLDALDALIDKAQGPKGESHHTQRAAVLALGKLANTRALKYLVDAAVDSNPDVRQAAVQALGDSKADGALSMLTFRLRDEVPKVREATAHALRHLAHPYAVRPLMDALQSEAVSVVRVAIVRALSQYSDRHDILPTLRKALTDDTPSVQEAAADALSQMDKGEVRTIDSLMDVLKEKKVQAEVRVAVIRALGTLKAQQASAMLMKELSGNRRWQNRFEAALALAAIHDPATLDGLRALLEGKDTDAAFAAAVALAGMKQDTDGVRKILRAGLNDPRFEARCIASESLGQIQDAEAIPALLKALRSRDAHLRRAAANAIKRIGSAATSSDLENLLQHPFIQVRQAARLALGASERPA